MDQKLIDKYIDRAFDAGIYEMLLNRWLEIYDEIEEWIPDGFTKLDMENLYEETKKQLNYHKDKK